MHLSPLKLGHRQRIMGNSNIFNILPILVPSKSTWTQHRVWGREALFPSKQQPKNYPNQKTEQQHSQTRDRNTSATPKHKERKNKKRRYRVDDDDNDDDATPLQTTVSSTTDQNKLAGNSIRPQKTHAIYG